MCGITGFCDFTIRSSKALLGQMNDTLQHRGPDADGLYFEQTDAYTLGLGHKRLSIIDLSTNGAQPMHAEHLSIVFNGEVYNYREIKKELLDKGYTFISDSDTEVVLKAFDCWQHTAVYRFIGMFAFAIFNKKTQELHLYRDRAGVKPLYYSFHNGVLLFGSELKALMAHPALDKTLDMDALSFYLKSGYYHAPHTVFEYTKKLEPGHYLTLDIQRQQLSTTCYWNVVDFYNCPVRHVQEDELLHDTEQLMQSAFNYRMVADVPVGIFLSGGYDSSAVAALLQKDRTQKIKTFTIGFHEEGFNEAPFAKQVAHHLGTEHYEYYCTRKEAQDLLPQLPFYYDEPFADSSAIPTMLVSAFARKQVAVALSADGGDELFGGYGKYFGYSNPAHKLLKLPFALRRGLAPLASLLRYAPGLANAEIKAESLYEVLNARQAGRYFIEPRLFGRHSLHGTLLQPYETPSGAFNDFSLLAPHVDLLNSMLAVDYKTYMVDDILTKVDRATMSVSLEGREPMLDHRLVEYLATIPGATKTWQNKPKHLLRSIVHQYLPQKLMDRRKMGFGVPLVHWFKDELRDYFEIFLNEEELKADGIFNHYRVRKIRDVYNKNNNKSAEVAFAQLWHITIFRMWQKQWL
jgi:asparagine synthase (glutamine-hydrolysing)